MRAPACRLRAGRAQLAAGEQLRERLLDGVGSEPPGALGLDRGKEHQRVVAQTLRQGTRVSGRREEQHELGESVRAHLVRGPLELRARPGRVVDQQAEAARRAGRGDGPSFVATEERSGPERDRRHLAIAGQGEERCGQRSEVAPGRAQPDDEERAGPVRPALGEALDEPQAVGRVLVEGAEAVR
jgi:hypothetical protein